MPSTARAIAALLLFATSSHSQEPPPATPTSGPAVTTASTDSPTDEPTNAQTSAPTDPAPAPGNIGAAQLAAALTGASAGDWTYASRGPEEWYTGFPECAGRLQSPIELSSGACASDTCTIAHQSRPAFLRMFQPRLAPTSLPVINTGYSLQINMTSRGITLSSELFWSQFTLEKMEYQMPSGHVIDGKRYPVEKMMTFKPSDAGALEAAGNTRYARVVISEVYEMSATETDPTLEMLFSGGVTSNMASRTTTQVSMSEPLQLSLEGDVYNYPGSFVTPPCSEVVYWNVLAKPKPASAAQLAQLQQLVENNMQAAGRGGSPAPSPRTHIVLNGVARPTQPSNGRTVKMRTFFGHDFAE